MMYLKFKDFLSESLLLEAEETGPLRANMAGNINDASKKGLRHLKNYVMPTLNKAQKKKVMTNFHDYFTQDEHDKLAKAFANLSCSS